ncbi:MAG: thioredoxin family protein [Bacteroidota bacterium]|jgi:small redox-active disulfide protein 2|nr:thioredoxin family protein [Bacteroidota bacterium]
MDIKVLGTGCAKCLTLEKNVRAAVAQLNLDATVTKVDDIMDIMTYGIMTTPALVVDGHVVLKGRVADEKEIMTLLT